MAKAMTVRDMKKFLEKYDDDLVLVFHPYTFGEDEAVPANVSPEEDTLRFESSGGFEVKVLRFHTEPDIPFLFLE